jgi:hypothetical protein
MEVDVARWLLAHELGAARDPGALAAAAERVCRKLSGPLARLITLVGYQALMARALHLAKGSFPFLTGVQTGSGPDECLPPLTERIQGIDSTEVYNGLAAVFAHVIGLLTTFLGDDLTRHLLADIWPDIPLGQGGGGEWEARA